MRGGARKGAGRKAGQASTKTREIANQASAQGITPLEVMLLTMRKAWDANDTTLATAMAKDAAPYIHPRLAATEVKMDADVRSRVISDKPQTEDEWEREYTRDSVGAPAGPAEGVH